MKKATSKSTSVQVARPGSETVTAPYKKGQTVEELFEQENISISSSEEVYIEADRASMQDLLEAGDLIQIVGKKEGGAK